MYVANIGFLFRVPNKDGLSAAKIASLNEHVLVYMYLKKIGGAA